MFAVDTTTITVPSWVDRIALPEYPAMPMLGYVMLGTGALLLLVGYFAPIRKVLTLLTALTLMAYYPLAFLLSWFLFRFDEKGRALREKTKFETFLFEHTRAFDWVILGVCAFFGLLFFVWTVWATVRKGRRRTHPRDEINEDNPFTSQPPPLAPRPTAPAPPPATRPTPPRPAPSSQVPQARKVVKKPPPSSSDNPFNFG